MPSEITQIDALLQKAWRESELTESAPATDRGYCRRLFLDVLGRIPSIDELSEFTRDRRPQRRLHWVMRLLNEDRYAAEYAENWSTIWTNLLIGRSDDGARDRMVDRLGLEEYLQISFAENRPYDRMVHDLIAAQGTNRPGSPKFNGAVNYLSGKLDDGATLATAHSARLFLGLQVQCTQCHNHPFNEWKQSQFWQLNSFFRQTAALRRFEPGTGEVRFIELTDQDFGGEDRPRDPEHARVYFELRNGQLEAAYPVFIDGQAIGTSGYVEDVNRRRELADMMVRSPELSRAIVNRMWGRFLGYGFTRPVDDMGPHNLPVLPDLLEYLAQRFRESGYDLKQLISWIVLSQPYQLSSRPTGGNQRDDPAAGQPPQFSHFYLRQMTAEQLYRSLLVATQADRSQGSRQQQQEAQRRWLRQFTIAFGTDEGDETTTFDGTITQTLMMFNGDLMAQATAAKPGSFLDRVARDQKQRLIDKVQTLFLASLARRASADEIRAFQQLLVYHNHNEVKSLQDIWWALLNSNEFILNH